MIPMAAALACHCSYPPLGDRTGTEMRGGGMAPNVQSEGAKIGHAPPQLSQI